MVSTVRPMPVSAKISAGIQSVILSLISPSNSSLTEFFSRDISSIKSFSGVSIDDEHTCSILTAVRFRVKRTPRCAIIANISLALRNSTSLTLFTQRRGSPFFVIGRYNEVLVKYVEPSVKIYVSIMRLCSCPCS